MNKNRFAPGFLVAAFVLFLCGCTSIMVLTGLRVRLEKTPVASIKARLAEGTAMYPGQSVPLIVMVTQPDGKALLTEGAGNGVVLWEDLAITSSIASVDSDGIASLPADPRVSEGKLPRIAITVPSHPGIRAELEIPLRYDAEYTANFSGRQGRSGSDGSDGESGKDGKDGSTDPKKPVRGRDGEDGEDGSDGTDGERGEDAPPVHVRVGLRTAPRPMLQVVVSNAFREERFLVDPRGGSLIVNAEGGAGGIGGKGGRGGRGGKGGTGSSDGSNGRDGRDGRDGLDGPPGRPGPITVIFDPRARAYLPIIQFFNRSGSGRPGPPPEFRPGPEGPLW